MNENETETKKELKNPEILILYKRCQIQKFYCAEMISFLFLISAKQLSIMNKHKRRTL